MSELLEMAKQHGGQYTVQRNPTKYSQDLYLTYCRGYARDTGIAVFLIILGLCILIVGSWSLLFGYFDRFVAEIGRLAVVAFATAALCSGIAVQFTLRLRWREMFDWLDEVQRQPNMEIVSLVAPTQNVVRIDDAVIVAEMGTAVIKQPEAASFRHWLTAVLARGSRVQFSMNEAAKRGYTNDMFNQLISELHRIGWMRQEPDGNNVYRLTQAGEQQGKEWLSK